MTTPTPKSKIVRLEARALCIHPHAQRELVPSKLRKMLAEFDLDAVGVFHAVQYAINGKTAIWIVDGQHRWQTLMNLELGEWLVDVMIHIDSGTDARASALFLKLNSRAPVSPFAKFANEVRADVPVAVGVSQLVHAHQLKVAYSAGNGNVCCVDALKRIFAFDAGRALSLTLETAVTAWGRTEAAVDGKILQGLGIVHSKYNGSINLPSLVKKLAKYPGGASGLIGDARGVRAFRPTVTLPRCIAERVIELYNSGRSSEHRLPPL
jgi:hypothetical protein